MNSAGGLQNSKHQRPFQFQRRNEEKRNQKEGNGKIHMGFMRSRIDELLLIYIRKYFITLMLVGQMDAKVLKLEDLLLTAETLCP